MDGKKYRLHNFTIDGTQKRPEKGYPASSYIIEAYRNISKKKAKQKRLLLLGGSVTVLIAISLIIMLIVLLCKGCSAGKTEIYGMWSIDGVTKYEFIDDTNGAMVLPHGNFAFTYALNENIISIDFTDEHLIDSEYEFTLTGDKLIFKNEVAEYVMTREKKE